VVGEKNDIKQVSFLAMTAAIETRESCIGRERPSIHPRQPPFRSL
jgi:hypothetical protein